MRTGRRRAVTTLGMVLGIALLAGLVAAVVGRPSSPAGPVYTVAQVRAGLARQPAAWAGRTVLVRGVAVESDWATGPTTGQGHLCDVRFSSGPPHGSPPFCPLTAPNGATVYLTLIDDSVSLGSIDPIYQLQQAHQVNTMTLDLAVQPVASNPLIALARRLPPLAHFLSAQEQVSGGVPHLYRIHLRLAGSTPCPIPFRFICGTAVLVDAQP